MANKLTENPRRNFTCEFFDFMFVFRRLFIGVVVCVFRTDIVDFVRVRIADT